MCGGLFYDGGEDALPRVWDVAARQAAKPSAMRAPYRLAEPANAASSFRIRITAGRLP